MSEETISQALTVCLSLHEAKNATVRHAAYMTIRQIISLLFDKVSQEAASTTDTTSSSSNDDSSTQQHSSSSSSSSVTLAVATGHRKSISMASALQQQQLTPTARCAYLVMSDLCTLSRGESGRCIRVASAASDS
eukprot:1805-Heterococcus_DN1.PRE.1